MKKTIPGQNEIWLVGFEPQVGTEIIKTRPAIVLTCNALEKLTTRIVVTIKDYKPGHNLVAYLIPINPDLTNNLL